MATKGKEIVPVAPSLVTELSDNSATVTLPEREQENIVEQLIVAIKKVAISEPKSEYELLPTHLDHNFEIANLLTEPKYVGEVLTQGERLVRYYHGEYHGKPLEFAIEHEDVEPETSETPILAWGVRKIPHNRVGELPTRRVSLPSGLYKLTMIEVRQYPETDHPLGQAA